MYNKLKIAATIDDEINDTTNLILEDNRVLILDTDYVVWLDKHDPREYWIEEDDNELFYVAIANEEGNGYRHYFLDWNVLGHSGRKVPRGWDTVHINGDNYDFRATNIALQ